MSFFINLLIVFSFIMCFNFSISLHAEDDDLDLPNPMMCTFVLHRANEALGQDVYPKNGKPLLVNFSKSDPTLTFGQKEFISMISVPFNSLENPDNPEVKLDVVFRMKGKSTWNSQLPRIYATSYLKDISGRLLGLTESQSDKIVREKILENDIRTKNRLQIVDSVRNIEFFSLLEMVKEENSEIFDLETLRGLTFGISMASQQRLIPRSMIVSVDIDCYWQK